MSTPAARHQTPAARPAGQAAALAIALLTVWTLAVSSAQASALAAVGEATLVIGNAQRLAADGQAEPVARGSLIREGDTIETQAGGHVHVRFSDGGRVSVRPSSRLKVENYRHDAANAQQSAIRFRLEEGVVRSITGTWGEAQRERFRLNTPLAAIGVKGTDFVVRSTGEATAASVFTGAIVLAPLSEQCAASLGPCLTGTEKLLSQDMRGQMLELSRATAVPQLVPALDLLAASAGVAPPQRALSARPPEGPAALAAPPALPEATRLDAVAGRQVLSEARAAEALPDPASLAPPKVEQLTWARYPWAPEIASDDFSRRFEAALQQGRERLGGNGVFTLFRDAPAGAVAYVPPEGRADFRLANAAAAVVRQGAPLEPVQVSDARLSVDFSNAQFDTSLKVQGPQMGADTVAGNGSINTNGTLRQTGGNALLSGALNGNGREAGFLFQKGVGGAGVLHGITLWGR